MAIHPQFVVSNHVQSLTLKGGFERCYLRARDILRRNNITPFNFAFLNTQPDEYDFNLGYFEGFSHHGSPPGFFTQTTTGLLAYQGLVDIITRHKPEAIITSPHDYSTLTRRFKKDNITFTG